MPLKRGFLPGEINEQLSTLEYYEKSVVNFECLMLDLAFWNINEIVGKKR